MTDLRPRSGPRALVRFTITLLIVVIYVATQVQLAIVLVAWLDSFLGIACGVLAATGLLYVAGFFRRDLEEWILQDLEQLLPVPAAEGEGRVTRRRRAPTRLGSRG